MGVISARRAAGEKTKHMRVNSEEELDRKSAVKAGQDHADATARAQQKHENCKSNPGNWQKSQYGSPNLPPDLVQKPAEEDDTEEDVSEKETKGFFRKGKGKGK